MAALTITASFIDTTDNGFSWSDMRCRDWHADKFSLEESQYVLRSPHDYTWGLFFFKNRDGDQFCVVFGAYTKNASSDGLGFITSSGSKIIPDIDPYYTTAFSYVNSFEGIYSNYTVYDGMHWAVGIPSHSTVIDAKGRTIVCEFTVSTGSDLAVTIAVCNPEPHSTKPRSRGW